MSEEKNKGMFIQFLSDAIGKEAIDKLKATFSTFKTKFEGEPAATATQTDPAQTALEKTMKTKDGLMTISIAGDAPAVDVSVMDMTSGTAMDLADGTYMLEDGTGITVAAGKITDVKAAEVVAPIDQAAAVQQAAAQIQPQIAAQFAALKKDYEAKFASDISEIKQTQKDHNEMIKEIVNFNAMLMETPVTTSTTKTKFKALSRDEVAKLSHAEQVEYNYNKGK